MLHCNSGGLTKLVFPNTFGSVRLVWFSLVVMIC